MATEISRPERAGAFARKLLQRLLQSGVDGEPVNAPIRLGGNDLVGGMRREHRQLRCARAAPACALARAISSRGTTPAAATRSSTRSRAARAASGSDRAGADSGDCGKRDQQRRLAKRQLARLLAEIGERAARMPSRLPP